MITTSVKARERIKKNIDTKALQCQILLAMLKNVHKWSSNAAKKQKKNILQHVTKTKFMQYVNG